MRRPGAVVPFMILLAACVGRAPSAGPTPAAAPVSAAPGALRIVVEPNPIVAVPVEGSTFEFPFTVSIREIGGGAVTIERVGIDVLSVGGLKVYSSELGAAEIERRGYRRTVAPHGEVRYAWRPRQQVPDERLFATLTGELWAEGIDAGGRRVTTRARVTVRRG